MRYILIFLSLINIGFSAESGGIISAKDYNQNTYMVGDIKHSLLSENKFQELAGDCWVKMRGQSSINLKDGTTQTISSTDYGTLMSVNVLPNSEGRFLRDVGGNAPTVANTQEDAIRNIVGEVWPQWNEESGWHRILNDGGVFVQGSKTTAGRMQGTDTGNPVGYSIRFDASRVVPTSDENRPINMAVNFFVKINKQCN